MIQDEGMPLRRYFSPLTARRMLAGQSLIIDGGRAM
jgi:hypothetical protein